ncbi:MAG: glycosyltransferase family 1 protein [Acidobacteriota bacterium]
MKIAVDASCWANRRGYGRYIHGLLPALISADRSNDYVLIADRQTSACIPADLASISVADTGQAATEGARSGGSRSMRDVWKMSRTASKEKADVLFFPSVYTYFPVFTRATVIVAIHDVIAEDFPEFVFPSRRERFLWTSKVSMARWQADDIVTVSRHARDGIVRRFGVDPSKVTVVSEAADASFRPLEPSQIHPAQFLPLGIAERDRILLYVGGVNPHKNLSRLIQALAGARNADPALEDLKLVICGDVEREHFTPGLAHVRETVRAESMQQQVVFTGYLPDGDVCQLMNRASALALPSLAEGFGLPAVEAAACGTPVIATRNSPLPQILEGGGIFVDPLDTAAMAEAIRRIFTDAPFQRQLAHVALERASQLTWSAAAEAMIGLLARIEADRR